MVHLLTVHLHTYICSITFLATAILLIYVAIIIVLSHKILQELLMIGIKFTYVAARC